MEHEFYPQFFTVYGIGIMLGIFLLTVFRHKISEVKAEEYILTLLVWPFALVTAAAVGAFMLILIIPSWIAKLVKGNW